MLSTKYSTYSAWAKAQNSRLKSWGFNAVGQNSDRYGQPANFPSGGVPVEQKQSVSGHAKRDDVSGGIEYYHCKSINYNYTGQLCASDYIPPDGGQLDVFDASCDGGKGVSGAFMADLGANGNDNIYNTSTGGASVSNILFAVTEEADDLYGLGNVHTHEDLGADILNHTPVQAVSPNTPKYNYPNATLDAKIARRDWLAHTYGCANPADGGIGTPIANGDDLYGAAAYCGPTNASKALAALNGAWHTGYTTWSTSDVFGEAGIKVGGVIRSARLPSLLTPVALESGRGVVTPTVLMEPAPACSMRTEETASLLRIRTIAI